MDDKSEEESEAMSTETNADQKKAKTKKCPKIKIDMNAIPSIDDQESELKDLGITAFDQSIYEENVMLQVDRALEDNCRTDRSRSLQNVLDFNSKNTSIESTPLLRITSENTFLESDSQTISSVDSDSQNKSSILFNELTKINEIVGQFDESTKSDEEVEEEVKEEDEDYGETDAEDEWKPNKRDYEEDSEEEIIYDEDNEEYLSDDDLVTNGETKTSKKKKKVRTEVTRIRKRVTDDGNDKCFRKRIKEYKREKLIERHNNIRSDGTEIVNLDEMVKLDNGYQIPKRIWDQLFPYQQTAVKWLWELHQLGCGGIIGDEMGLGKTIQVIAFLCGLSCSRFHDFRDLYTTLGPVLLVCPATIMHQWVAEFHKWWPYFRVAVLHQTGSFTGKRETLIRAINKSNGILITSYSGVCSHQKHLLRHDWHYVILDEGHKIRNPEAQVTHACKLLTTPHRIILSGSPIQNNLRELWSLFDFVYPGKLGTLPVFMEHFAVPITQGGYANATQVQIQVAYKMATILRDSIKPYLLRRMKDEVKSSLTLPSKNEQVLFCKLTDEQRELYKTYLASTAVKEIMRGSTQIFVGLINLRKICNHPNLFHIGADEVQSRDDFGYYKRSGKMIVVDALLKIWHKQNHKVLVFTQSRQMLKILESYLRYKSYTYLMMDGSTNVQTRQPLIKEFNTNPNIFVFLLTTRVGGIGVNLTGANRVLIYDPDWNPSTDVQARERCWRIGQNRDVTIYRLLSSGTVEEKIYHRQIFKQYLTNRVLKDPKQRRFFKTNDLHELFTLSTESDSTESSSIFAGTDSDVKVNPKAKRQKTESKAERNRVISTQLSAEKVEELRNRAKILSKMIAEKFANKKISESNEGSNDCDINQPNTSKYNKDAEKSPKSSHSSERSDDLSENSSKSKHKKKKIGTKFEGKRIKYLVKQDIYKEKAPEKEKGEEDDYVLKKLFKRSKVHSALQHDVIESTSTQDFALAEKEAETMAKQAINALKKSRENCFVGQSSVNQILSKKTQKFGQKRKLSVGSETDSNSLINAIKSRNKYQNESDSEEESNRDIGRGTDTQYDVLLQDIRNFIAFQSNTSAVNPGEATTEELLSAFRDKLPAHQSAIFKSMLYQLCDFYRRPDKTGVWKLKPEFR